LSIYGIVSDKGNWFALAAEDMMDTNSLPRRCPICQQLLSLESCFGEQRCTDPDHWLAAGLLAANDYYLMAQLMACAVPEKATVKPAAEATPPARPARRAIHLKPRLCMPQWLRLPVPKVFRLGL
jgi:hypothetical protein